jgi:hypothetical protein
MGAQTTINVVWAVLCAYAAHRGSAVLCPQVEARVCWLGSSCRCEIKSVDDESRAKLNEEKQEKNIRKTYLGAQTTIHIVWARASPSYPRPVPVFIRLVVAV